MSQLIALIWLKWRLARNSLRSRKAAVGRAASVLGTLVGLVVALCVGAALGVATYAFTSEELRGGRGEQSATFFLLFIFVMVYMLWALVPLGLGGGSRFDAGRLLLYPVSLTKIFAIDFVSELVSLPTIFAAPTIFGMALGAGLAQESVGRALLLGAVACACGLTLSKMLSTAIGSLMRRRQTRGETALALLGGTLGLTGALMGQLAPYLARHADSFKGIRWTPPGAAAVALSEGLRAGGEASFIWALVTLSSYALLFVLVSYRIARRAALGIGGGSGRARAKRSATRENGEQYAGWQLPLMSAEMSALVEKELRYALRNAQLKVVAVMAVGLTIVLRMAPLTGASGGRRGGWESFSPYAEGAGAVFSVLYVFMLVSPLSTNLFGYDGAGVRAYVLAPVERWKILVGKNIALTLVTAVFALAATIAGALAFRDQSAGTLLFSLLAFIIYAGLFPLIGNWLSFNFPKRVEFGKRMNRSGVAGLLLVPVFLALGTLPLVAVVAAHFAQSHAVKYVILALFAAGSIGFYLLMIRRQGRTFARRELEIMEAVTGKTGEEGGQILT